LCGRIENVHHVSLHTNKRSIAACSHNVADVGVRRLVQYGEVSVSEGMILCACKLMHID